jgi:hypothetical protein
MATFNTDIKADQDSITAKDLIPGIKTTGNIVLLEATHTATGTEAATGDSIIVADLPIGAIVIAEDIRVACEASLGGSDVEIAAIGDAVDADRYGTAAELNSSTATNATPTPNIAASVVTRFVVTAATRTVIATVTRTNALTAGKKIKFRIPYLLP